jgi:hypothetical protein
MGSCTDFIIANNEMFLTGDKHIVFSKRICFTNVNDILSKRALFESKAGDADKILRTDYRKDNFRLQNEVGKLKAEKAAIVTERDKLQNKLNRFYSVFSYSPNFFEKFLRLLKEMERVQTEAERARLEKRLQRQLEHGETEM